MSAAGSVRAGARPAAGAILFEVLLSLALFLGAAAFTIGATRSVIRAIDRSGRESLAADLARSKMAELEAGLISLADLRDVEGGIERVGSIDPFGDDALLERPGAAQWMIEANTSRTEFTGLQLVELTVREEFDGASALDGAGGISFTLRQLIPVRDESEPGYEEDELLEGLPTETDSER